MKNMRKQVGVPWIVWLAGIIIGILFGLVVLGWWLWPVKWVDASPSNLIFNSQEDYTRMNIEAFGFDQNAALAKQRYEALGSNAEAALAAVIKYPAGLPPALITSFTIQVTGKTPVEVAAAAPQPPAAPWAFPTGIIVLFALLMLLIIGFFTYLVFDERRRQQPPVQTYTAPEFNEQAMTEVPTVDESASIGVETTQGDWTTIDEESGGVNVAATAAVVAAGAAIVQNNETTPATEAAVVPTTEENAQEFYPLDQEQEIIYPPEPQLPEEPVGEALEDDEVEPWEKRINKPLAYVEGIGEVYASKLAAAGITTTGMLLSQGATRKGRQEISEKSGIHEGWVLKWVNHIDLYRIKGVGSEYADLLETAGVDTVPELAMRRPDNLLATMTTTNEEKKLVRKMPVLSQVDDWVAQAKELPRIIEY